MGIDIGKIRNIAVIAHGGAGKTSLVEAVLFDTKATSRLGRVEEGNTVTDFEAEEIEHNHSISSAVAFCEWKGHRINILDTPGYINFIEDTNCALSAVDGAVVIVSALSGVKAETGKLWKYADEYKLPRIVFINKMDRDNADFQSALKSIETAYGISAVPVNIPMGAGSSFEGIINIVKMKAVKHEGPNMTEMDIPEQFMAEAKEYRKRMVESVAESDDVLLEKYLEGTDPTDDEVNHAINVCARTGVFVPVVCGSAISNIGMEQLLDNIVYCIPSPADRAVDYPIIGKDPKTGDEITRQPLADAPLSVRVFKTIADAFAGKITIFRVMSGTLRSDTMFYNSGRESKEKMGGMFYLQGKDHVAVKDLGPGEIAAVAKLKDAQTGDTLTTASDPIIFPPIKIADPMISYAIKPVSRGDEEKVGTGLHRLLEEDPALKFHMNPESKEMILGGMGQMHIEITLQKLKRKFGVDVEMKTPKVPYRETIRNATSAQGKYKKQSGGRGQYGDCHIKIEPLPHGGGFEFVNQIVGGSIPKQYIPAVEKGIIEKMKEGLIAGYPVVDIKATLYDGSYHNVDSSEMAFKIAGSMALQKASEKAGPVLLEPIVKAEISIPEEYLGGVIGDLNSKRGKVQGVETLPDGDQKVSALVPMAELLTYANQLNALTSGQGIYAMEASHYEEVPPHIAQKLVAEREAVSE